jgi:branched-chain amino acid transport system ATP-binding protein
MHKGLAIIKEEHRALAAVIHGLSYLVAEIDKGRIQPDFALFKAIIRYITDFPDRLHHPKEELYLFKALRKRSAEAAPVIAQLQADHERQPQELAAVQVALDRYERDGAAAFPVFAHAAQSYAESTFRHMAAEEGILVPMAMKALLDDDWKTIDEAFAANNDPMIGSDAQGEFRTLFTRIMTLAPAPIGLG